MEDYEEKVSKLLLDLQSDIDDLINDTLKKVYAEEELQQAQELVRQIVKPESIKGVLI